MNDRLLAEEVEDMEEVSVVLGDALTRRSAMLRTQPLRVFAVPVAAAIAGGNQ